MPSKNLVYEVKRVSNFTDCDTCAHINVCKYRDIFKDEEIDVVSHPLLTVKIRCNQRADNPNVCREVIGR